MWAAAFSASRRVKDDVAMGWFLFAAAAPFADAAMLILGPVRVAFASIRAFAFTKELVGDYAVWLDDFLHDSVAMWGLCHLRNEAKCGDQQDKKADDGWKSTRLGMSGFGWFHLIWWLMCILVSSAFACRLDRCATAAPPDRM